MYVTTRVREAPPKQLSFEDLFTIMLEQRPDPIQVAPKAPYTRTFYARELPVWIAAGCHPDEMIDALKQFNDRWDSLHRANLSTHYRKFFIPKKTGGMREINAPDDDLMNCLTELRQLLVSRFYASHHAAAYAYVEGRSTRDAVAVHQYNQSKWFLKLDLSKFFPSTTLEFTMSMLERIYPFALVIQNPDGERELRKALSLGFLNGGLPMGTPLSPMLTNLIMIPFDYEFSRYLRSRYKPENNADGKGRMFAYTRYADDMDISCRIGFRYSEVVDKIKEIFRYFGAPYRLNEEKTHYGSRYGKNWMLGVMLNGDNDITIGYRKKKAFRATLSNYASDQKNGTRWPLDQLQWLNGLLSYYRMVNAEYINKVVKNVGEKYGINIDETISNDIAMA